jgi:hypothetical protein
MKVKSRALDEAGLLKELRAIKQIVERLEQDILSSEESAIDPYERRRQVLRQIYWLGNSISFQDLTKLLHSQGTDYRWIGQQVKKGYLSVLPLPGGGKKYSVTPRAVLELELGREEATEEVDDLAALAKLSDASFGEDWNSREDAVYDKL